MIINFKLRTTLIYFFLLSFLMNVSVLADKSRIINIPDTGQSVCYDNNKELLKFPAENHSLFGQDANYETSPPAYRDNKDGTITDLNTNLTWSKEVKAKKMTLPEALKAAKKLRLGGHNDWRIPTIKELYSLIDFRGYTGFSRSKKMAEIPENSIPFINTDYFDFSYGDIKEGERYIDAQWLSSTKYVSYTMNNSPTLFGVNFADGRIKGYPYESSRSKMAAKKFFIRFVRGETNYGKNIFRDNKDGTVTDLSTSLVWMKNDSSKALSWKNALEYANNCKIGGYRDWRLPNAKELQYIVDYKRSPDTTNSAAIDPVFNCSSIKNEAGQKDFPYYWTSTTHLDGPDPGKNAAYISFGRSLGKMDGKIIDVHGAGSQRSDPKKGTTTFRGPQGDLLRSKNFVRLVRGGKVTIKTESSETKMDEYPIKIKLKQITHPENKTDKKINNKNNSRRRKGGGFIERLDRNNDNKISLAEFDGPKDHFNMFDKNNDGYLTSDEDPGPPQRKRNSRGMRF